MMSDGNKLSVKLVGVYEDDVAPCLIVALFWDFLQVPDVFKHYLPRVLLVIKIFRAAAYKLTCRQF